MKSALIANADLAERTKAVLIANGISTLSALVSLGAAGSNFKGLDGATPAILVDIREFLDELRATDKPKRPRGGGGIMKVDKARGPIAEDDYRTAVYRALNYFPTEPWAGRCVGDLIRAIDPVATSAQDPAAGEGHLVHALSDYFPDVRASDIYGHDGKVAVVRDYLGPPIAADSVDWMITNPPYDHAEEFVRVGLQRARRGVAVFGRLTWLDSKGRDRLFFGDQPLTLLATFSERVQCLLGRWDPSDQGQTPCAWFVWVKRPELQPSLDPRVRAAWSLGTYVGARFPPGSKARFSSATDVAKFGVKS